LLCGATGRSFESPGLPTSVCGAEMVQQITNQNEVRIPKCVVVVYEAPAIRERAVHFCERLAIEQKSTDIDMDWWSFTLLSHPTMAHNAMEKAANADVVVFAMDARGDLPEEIKLWIEKWLNKRGEREGALVGLLGNEEGIHDLATFREMYLRHAARRAGMDYLSHAAPTLRRAIPDSIDSFSKRAGQVTSVLDSILQKHPHSSPPAFQSSRGIA
jgi:hypothetical protein